MPGVWNGKNMYWNVFGSLRPEFFKNRFVGNVSAEKLAGIDSTLCLFRF